MKKIEKYLTEYENTPNIGKISGDIKGIKMWLDTLEELIAYGNIKDAKLTMNNISKQFNKLKVSIK